MNVPSQEISDYVQSDFRSLWDSCIAPTLKSVKVENSDLLVAEINNIMGEYLLGLKSWHIHVGKWKREYNENFIDHFYNVKKTAKFTNKTILELYDAVHNHGGDAAQLALNVREFFRKHNGVDLDVLAKNKHLG